MLAKIISKYISLGSTRVQTHQLLRNDTWEVIRHLRGIVAEPHKWCGTDFLDLASLDPLWNTPSWDIKNGILEKFFLHSGGLAQLIF